MKNKNGFISISIIYTFFIVFLLIMLSMLAAYLNKKWLKNQYDVDFPYDSVCSPGEKFTDCLFKAEAAYAQGFNNPRNTHYVYLKNVFDRNNDGNIVDDIQTAIQNRKDKPSAKDYHLGATQAESMFRYADELGISTYYRGNVENNYVSFAGFRWRIVRINGDGSIRLILENIPNNTVRKDLLTNPVSGTDANIISCTFGYSRTIPQKGNEYSLVTPFNNPDKNFLCEPKSRMAAVGLMYNKKPDDLKEVLSDLIQAKDYYYANDNESDILTTLYKFYETRLSKEAKNINSIYQNALFCADKNISKEETGTAIRVIEAYTEQACEFYHWKWLNNICVAPWVDLFSVAHLNIIYYKGIVRITSGKPEFTCQESKQGAKNKCHETLNLSTYSANPDGKVFYNIDRFDECDSWTGLAQACVKKREYTWTDLFGYSHTIYLGCEDNDNEISMLYPKLAMLRSEGKAGTKGDYEYNKPVGNGQLKYPIGLISADEAMFSGVGFESSSSAISSEDSKLSIYWTGTAAYGDYNESISQYLAGNSIDSFLYGGADEAADISSAYYYMVDGGAGFKMARSSYLVPAKNDEDEPEIPNITARPVINLKKTCKYAKGTGTADDPYEIGAC